tara:strand:- start:1324 stop:1584 length:261 start_codon:yes stop_codon:yes gene_type:complete
MVKKNIYDSVVDRVVKRVEMVSDKIGENFKGVKPFQKEPLSPADQLYTFNQITPEIETMMRQEMGDETVDDYFAKMNQLRRKFNAT